MELHIFVLPSIVNEILKKGIIIGNKGALLRKIGAEARMDIQKLLATKVYLDLWVKVKKGLA